ncbi:M23 family metallopeptidase [Halobacillus litoralis]|uniref:peptidoglycan DD-metalloendopeptidase family protein n=1 Tax=Halobacillus litoralis TaxID=45668 RepID=UPI001CD45519|nr:M23 family metallopeptidase [Halobacillus litoralis]MCA0971011.1 M23 family metallopeptidase [Halobacillus litoralis]
MTKLKFKRLMRKKWLYPALYLSVAALVLVGVFWYQQGADNLDQVADEPDTQVEDEILTNNTQEESVPVMEQEENLQMPVVDEAAASIVTKFYDYDASEADQESALVLYNNKYYQSEGVDITREDGEAFEVTAAMSGTVTEIKEDPLYGNVIELSHDGEVSTVYASLDQVQVETGAEVTQGDVLGTAGSNSFGQASGVHVHFEVRAAGEPVNPENFFGQPVSKIKDGAEQGEEEEGAQDNTPMNEDGAEDEDAQDNTPAVDEDEEGTPSEEPSESEEQPTPEEDSASSISTFQA